MRVLRLSVAGSAAGCWPEIKAFSGESPASQLSLMVFVLRGGLPPVQDPADGLRYTHLVPADVQEQVLKHHPRGQRKRRGRPRKAGDEV